MTEAGRAKSGVFGGLRGGGRECSPHTVILPALRTLHSLASSRSSTWESWQLQCLSYHSDHCVLRGWEGAGWGDMIAQSRAWFEKSGEQEESSHYCLLIRAGQGSLECCSPQGCEDWTWLSDWTTASPPPTAAPPDAALEIYFIRTEVMLRRAPSRAVSPCLCHTCISISTLAGISSASNWNPPACLPRESFSSHPWGGEGADIKEGSGPSWDLVL